MTYRFLCLTDVFNITCKKCGSSDVDLDVDECDECGNTINGYCNNCKARYRYHDFERVEVKKENKDAKI